MKISNLSMERRQFSKSEKIEQTLSSIALLCLIVLPGQQPKVMEIMILVLALQQAAHSTEVALQSDKSVGSSDFIIL